MGHQHQGGSGRGIDLENQPYDLLGGFRVKVAGWLVGEKNLGTIHEGPGNGDALLLASRKLDGIVMQTIFQTDPFEKLSGAAPRVILAADLGGHHHVLQSRERRQQLKALKDKADELVADSGQRLLAGEMHGDAIE